MHYKKGGMFIMYLSLIMGGFFFLVTTGTFIFELINKQGNHWFLFGTWIDRLLVNYPLLVCVVFILPLVIPLFFNKSLFYKIAAASALPLFFYYMFVFHYLAD